MPSHALNPLSLMTTNAQTTRAVAPVNTAPTPLLTDRKVRRQRRDELREEEWAMHRELMATARAVLKSFYENPQKASVADVTRMVDLASRIGRLSTEPDREEHPGADGEVLMIEFHAALQKVYARRAEEGRPLPVDTMIAVTSAAPADGGVA